MIRRPPRSTLFPYTDALPISEGPRLCLGLCVWRGLPIGGQSGSADHANLQYRRDEPSSLRDQQPSRRRCHAVVILDRKSTRLNSSHLVISYAVFCLKKKRWRGFSFSASLSWGRPPSPPNRFFALFTPPPVSSCVSPSSAASSPTYSAILPPPTYCQS